MTLPLLDLRHLSVRYPTAVGALRAVRDLSLRISPGETLALVGETGCGKSTVALTLMGLLGAGQIESGEILFEGRDLRRLDENEWRKIRGREISIVFQDARSALNPVRTVGDHMVEAMRAHQPLSRREAGARSLELLHEVGVPEPAFQTKRYPFELSGGMCQRVGIALALCNNPRLLIADEPTSALDPTIQMQVVELLAELKHRHGLALLMISHDLALVSHSADQVAVMYHSRLVECGPRTGVLGNPAHPYTRALRDAVPDLTRRCDFAPLAVVPGTAPAPGEEIAGCPFAPRCREVEPRCADAPSIVSDGHWASCVLEAGGHRSSRTGSAGAGS
jgi:oligopeptide/dipeptide ABC transporter ATP-binding protein